MPKRRNIYVIGGHEGYATWMSGRIVDRMDDADLVCLTGGEDVSSHLYGEKAHPTTYANGSRDKYEVREFKRAQALGIPVIGICRGSQFACAMAGGKLVQDQHNPSFLHDIETIDGQHVLVSSTHHQAAYPWNLEPAAFTVIGWSVSLSPYHQGGDCEEMVLGKVPGEKECEIVHYPAIRTIGIQSHPEMLYGEPEHEPMIDYMRSLLNKHLETGGRAAV